MSDEPICWCVPEMAFCSPATAKDRTAVPISCRWTPVRERPSTLRLRAKMHALDAVATVKYWGRRASGVPREQAGTSSCCTACGLDFRRYLCGPLHPDGGYHFSSAYGRSRAGVRIYLGSEGAPPGEILDLAVRFSHEGAGETVSMYRLPPTTRPHDSATANGDLIWVIRVPLPRRIGVAFRGRKYPSSGDFYDAATCAEGRIPTNIEERWRHTLHRAVDAALPQPVVESVEVVVEDPLSGPLGSLPPLPGEEVLTGLVDPPGSISSPGTPSSGGQKYANTDPPDPAEHALNATNAST